MLLDLGAEDGQDAGLPRVLHWGRDAFGPAGDPVQAEWLRRIGADLEPAVPHSALDQPWPLTLLPGQADGWSGRPGLSGAWDGGGPEGRYPHWRLDGVPQVLTQPDGAQWVSIAARCGEPGGPGLSLRTELRLEACGVLRMQHTLTPVAPSGRYHLSALNAVLPVPQSATEIEDLTGRWCRERSPQRSKLALGTWARESRRGRTGHDATLLLAAGTAGFAFRTGEVWAAHVGWSGDHVHLLERLPEGAGSHGGSVLGGGELLSAGEVVLGPGESYTTPWVYFVHSDQGLDGVTARLHRWLRSRPQHPRGPRPLVLNTWEAVYFDQGLESLTDLAERAAAIGVERFVLDDGWFGGRRNDLAGLGDWEASAEIWPQGLRPLADRVRELGMDFGLWVEPEMVNLDSDLARAHPDWLLPPARPSLPRSWRHQYLLDLAHPEAYAYLLERLDALVDEIGIAFLKWDHNRDLHETGAHAQTLALYALLDELRARHPGLEIESCASGGARVDLGILERTDRIWASDTNDPVERQQIQRWTASLLPLELIGSHIGGPVSHTTGRVSELTLRGITALFGHSGIEWDITSCNAAELEALRRWAGLYKELRGLLHSGDLVRLDQAERPDGHVNPDLMVHGVVAPDRSEAVFALVRIRTSATSHPGRLYLPGLDPQRSYRVVRRDEAGVGQGQAISQPSWWDRGETEARGAVLGTIGLAAPSLNPSQGVLIHLRGR